MTNPLDDAAELSLEEQLTVTTAANRIARLLSKVQGLDAAIQNLMSEFIELVQADEAEVFSGGGLHDPPTFFTHDFHCVVPLEPSSEFFQGCFHLFR